VELNDVLLGTEPRRSQDHLTSVYHAVLIVCVFDTESDENAKKPKRAVIHHGGKWLRILVDQHSLLDTTGLYAWHAIQGV
jgi:hypothetical protein